MTMTNDKIKEINEQYNGNFKNKLDLKLNDGLDGTIVVKNNWQVCKLEELSTMIEELTDLRTAIANETGIVF